MKKKTVQIKSQLAKLLATENIEVQENQVKTASFDVKNRILTIPILKEEHKSKYVYDMLVGHEVSHALHTPSKSWADMKNKTDEFRSFVNVLEDVRIDKLIQKKYPGLVKDYLLGFKKMYKDNFFGTKGKDNFFGTKGKDLSTYALIDKLNLYFKSSKTLNFNFNKKENYFVDLVNKCKTFKDVLKLAEDILGHCKEEIKKSSVLKKVYAAAKDGEEDKQDSDSSNSDNSFKEDEKLPKGIEEKLNEYLDKKVSDGKPEEKKDKDKDKDKNNEVGAGTGAGGDTKINIRSITNEAYDNAVQKIQDDDASSRSYAQMPGIRLNKLIIPYKKYIRDFAKHDSKLNTHDKNNLSTIKETTKKFLSDSSNIVNYLVKEFEMKKNAKMYARATIAKTGIIDPLKLYQYKFAEDIFKKMSNIPNQKNHGMIFLLDWSGSMQRHLLPTVEQLLNLVMFCRKINIPFSVYKFMNNSSNFDKRDTDPDAPFIVNDKTIQPDQSTRLVQMFTHKQGKSDFLRSAQNLHRSALYFSGYYNWRDSNQLRVPSISDDYYLSSTPLNESLVAMDTIIKKFKNDNKTDKVALITLTDGSSNSMSTVSGGQLMIKLGKSYKLCHFSWRGENKKDLTGNLLTYLKKKYDLQTIGFYLASKYKDLRYIFNPGYSKEELARRTFTKQKFIADYGTAYDVYFYIKSDTKVKNQVFEQKDTTNKRLLKKMFMSGMKKRLDSRVLLRNFIKRVA